MSPQNTVLMENSETQKTGVLVCRGCLNKMPQTGWLKQQKFILHSCVGWKLKFKCWQSWFLLRAFFFWLADATFWLCPHMVSVHPWCLFLFSPIGQLSYWIGSPPISITSLSHTYFIQSLSPNIVMFEGTGVRTSVYEFEGTQFSPWPLAVV